MRRFGAGAAVFRDAFGAQAPTCPTCRSFAAVLLRPSVRLAELGRLVCWRPGRLLLIRNGFHHSVKSLTNFIERTAWLQAPLEQWALLSKNHTQSSGFGAFVGRKLAMGRPRLWIRGQLQLLLEPAGLVDQLDDTADRQSGRRESAGGAHPYLCTTLSGNAGIQIKDV